MGKSQKQEAMNPNTQLFFDLRWNTPILIPLIMVSSWAPLLFLQHLDCVEVINIYLITKYCTNEMVQNAESLLCTSPIHDKMGWVMICLSEYLSVVLLTHGLSN